VVDGVPVVDGRKELGVVSIEPAAVADETVVNRLAVTELLHLLTQPPDLLHEFLITHR